METPDKRPRMTSRRIKDLREISIAIDTWDDIFSSFDPRPLDERVLSEDFMSEIKRRYRETKSGEYAISIFAPDALRDEASEQSVIQRLKEHFRDISLKNRRQINRIRLRGAIFVLMGILLLGYHTMETYLNRLSEITIDLLGILLVPIGWFGVWEGFSKFVDSSPIFNRDAVFFDKLSRAEFKFVYLDETEE